MNGIDATTAQPRLSRETRRLLAAAMIALIALWVLVRVRFPDRPVTPNPISPLLTQLTTRPAFNDLAAEIGRLRSRLAPALVTLGADAARGRVGLRFGVDSAITYIPAAERDQAASDNLIALDRATGLAIVRVDSVKPTFVPVPWSPERAETPRYLASTEALTDGVGLNPFFVSGLHPLTTPAWSGSLWQLPAALQVPSGSLVFTADGELAGLMVRESGVAAIVPGETLLSDAQRLLAQSHVVPGKLGVSTRSLTPALSTATGAQQGVVVSWVDPRSVAAAHVQVGDVIESVNGTVVKTSREWDVKTARLAAGDNVELSVRRGGQSRAVKLVAAATPAPRAKPLGLTLRFASGMGSEVLHVDPLSAAAAAGIVRGDYVSSVGASRTPTPSRLREAYGDIGIGESIVVGITRGDAHDVVVLTK